jgi:hypothetical protein
VWLESAQHQVRLIDRTLPEAQCCCTSAEDGSQLGSHHYSCLRPQLTLGAGHHPAKRCCSPGARPGPGRHSRAGQLRITQVTVGGALPAEGALSYIPVERANGATVTERQLQGRGKLTLGGRLKTGGRGR